MIENMTHEKWETITEVLDLLDLHRDNAESMLEKGRARGDNELFGGKVDAMLEGKVAGLNSLRTSLVNKYRR